MKLLMQHNPLALMSVSMSIQLMKTTFFKMILNDCISIKPLLLSIVEQL